ncbi:hypothetical protein Tco_1515667 [Tanacetum coccineum]
MAALKFASSHNMVAFLDKPIESDEFEQIVDFLNAHLIKYALTVNITIYTACIEQFWATRKVKTVNGEVHIQALVDKKKVIITKTSIRRDLQLADENGTKCLPNATIFAELERIGAKTTAWNEFSSTMASAIICLATNQKFNFSMYIFDNMVKNLEGGVKFLMYPREGKDFSGRVTLLFQTMMVQAPKELGEGSEIPIDPQYTPTINQPSSSRPPNKQKPKKTKKHMADETEDMESVPIHSNDPLLSGEVKKLERRSKSRTPGLKRLRKVSRTARIESSEDEGLGTQENASKQGRKIANLNVDAEVTLVDESQERNDDNLMFNIGVFDEQEVEIEKVVSTPEVTTASTTTTVDELTLAQPLIEIKAAKPKSVTTATTITTTVVTRPKARGVVVQEPSEFRTTTSSSQTSQLPQAKDKGKAKMIEPEKPLKKKDQILVDEEIAQRLQEELQAKLEEEERLERQKEEEDNLISWDNTQAIMETDYERSVEGKLKVQAKGKSEREEEKNVAQIPEINMLKGSTQRLSEIHRSLYPKMWWEPLPRDVVGASTQRCGGSLYPKMWWEPLPNDVVDASWQMEDFRKHVKVGL